MNVNINNKKTFLLGSIFVLFFVFLPSCDFTYELPEAGSIADETPPSASFDFKQNDDDYLTLDFSNLSGSATDYAWNFGDGSTSTDKDPSHTYAEIGTYTVSLASSDKLGVVNTISRDIEIIEPIDDFEPEILNPGFDEPGEDSHRDHWTNDLRSTFSGLQITGSPVHTPEKAGKLPSDGSRLAYQLVAVQPNKNYIVSFYYTMKTSPEGTLNVAILGGHLTDEAQAEAQTITKVVLTDQTDANSYVQEKIGFNSGDNSEIAIYITNVGVECRFDTFSIENN